MGRPRYTVEELDATACRKLLGCAPMGRIAYTDRALPRILPVHCTLRDDEVVIARRAGATLQIRQGEIVAFEADHYDPLTREGWSVSLVGTCRVITDDDEIAELDAMNVAPWASDDGSVYIGISIGALLHGRALSAAPQPEAVAARTA